MLGIPAHAPGPHEWTTTCVFKRPVRLWLTQQPRGPREAKLLRAAHGILATKCLVPMGGQVRSRGGTGGRWPGGAPLFGALEGVAVLHDGGHLVFGQHHRRQRTDGARRHLRPSHPAPSPRDCTTAVRCSHHAWLTVCRCSRVLGHGKRVWKWCTCSQYPSLSAAHTAVRSACCACTPDPRHMWPWPHHTRRFTL